jgi:hypothetical protein
MLAGWVWVLALSWPCLGFSEPTTQAAGHDIERAVNCQLSDKELPGLLSHFKQAGAGGSLKRVAALALPTVDVYALAEPIVVQGTKVSSIAHMPARFLAVVPEEQGARMAKSLSLKTDAITGAMRRELGNSRAWVAFRLHHEALRGKMLIGCEYQVAAAL